MERNLFILREKMTRGQFFHLRGVPIDGLLRLRGLPNGRIDLLSVDESTRLKANMMAEFDGDRLPGAGAEDIDQSSPEAADRDIEVPLSDAADDTADFVEHLVDLCLEGDEQAAVEMLLVLAVA